MCIHYVLWRRQTTPQTFIFLVVILEIFSYLIHWRCIRSRSVYVETVPPWVFIPITRVVKTEPGSPEEVLDLNKVGISLCRWVGVGGGDVCLQTFTWLTCVVKNSDQESVHCSRNESDAQSRLGSYDQYGWELFQFRRWTFFPSLGTFMMYSPLWLKKWRKVGSWRDYWEPVKNIRGESCFFRFPRYWRDNFGVGKH